MHPARSCSTAADLLPNAVVMTCSAPGPRRPWQWILTKAAATSCGDYGKTFHSWVKRNCPTAIELPFAGGLIGYLSYDFGRHLEQLPHLAVDDLHLPDARFGLYAWALISDHLAQTSQLVFHPALADSERQRLITLFSGDAATAPATFKLQGPMAPDLSVRLTSRPLSASRITSRPATATRSTSPNAFVRRAAAILGSPYRALREACPTPFSGFQSLPDDGAVLEPVAGAFRQRQRAPGRNPPDQRHPPTRRHARRRRRRMPPNCWPAPRIAPKT